MILNKVPFPGANNGACDKECGHVYCNALRKTAKAKRLICGGEIGYENVFLQYEERIYHDSCVSSEKKQIS